MRKGLSCSEAGKLGYIKSKEKFKEHYKKIREDYEENPKRCKLCNKKIEYAKRRGSFCCHSHAASYNNININRHFKTKMEKHGLDINKPKDVKYYVENIRRSRIETRHCLFCNSPTYYKYCSSKCQQEHAWKIRKEEIIRRNAVDFNPVNNARVARRYVLETKGKKCEICGITEWMSKDVPLILDHTNGNPSDWQLSNLRLICGNCNMQLPTFAGRNRGHGRKTRRDIYKKLGYC